MKKLLFLVVAFFMSLTMFAQAQFTHTASNPTGTITNASADTMYYTVANVSAFYAIQPKFTKTSGTAAGTATLAASVNGIDYVATGDTYSLTNITTNTTIWYVNKAAKYFRVITNGGTTMVLVSSARISSGH